MRALDPGKNPTFEPNDPEATSVTGFKEFTMSALWQLWSTRSLSIITLTMQEHEATKNKNSISPYSRWPCRDTKLHKIRTLNFFCAGNKLSKTQPKSAELQLDSVWQEALYAYTSQLFEPRGPMLNLHRARCMLSPNWILITRASQTADNTFCMHPPCLSRKYWVFCKMRLSARIARRDSSAWTDITPHCRECMHNHDDKCQALRKFESGTSGLRVHGRTSEPPRTVSSRVSKYWITLLCYYSTMLKYLMLSPYRAFFNHAVYFNVDYISHDEELLFIYN